MKKLLALFAILLTVNVFSQIDRFEGRPTEASSDVAQAKENVPVKKESFKDKLARISADGNKVGVLSTAGSVYVKEYKKPQGSTTQLDTKVDAGVKGELAGVQGLEEFGPWLVSQLNDKFGTDVFELVDINKIPYKEVKVFSSMQKVDDWWSTKYKMVATYNIDCYYEAYTEGEVTSDARSFIGSFSVDTRLYILEYFIGKKGGTQKYIVNGRQMGSYNSEKYKGKEDTEVGSIEELAELVAKKSDSEIVEMLNAERESHLQKALGKLLK